MAERTLVVRLIGDSRSLERTFTRSGQSARGFSSDISKASRGALSAAVSFRGLGRALAFGSFQFLGGAGLGFALKSTIQAAEESQRVLAQTANAVEKSGLSWAKYGKQVQAAALAQSNLSGFDDERLLGTFSNLVRRTGDVTQALKLNALAIDVARGRNIELEAAQGLVLKASIGNVGALRRLGINVGKSASAYQALDLLQRKYAGSAAAYGRTATGAQDRFRVAIQNTQEAIGTALLPTITTYLNKGADWLNNTDNQRLIQEKLTTAVQDTAVAVGRIADAASIAIQAIQTLQGVLGGIESATPSWVKDLLTKGAPPGTAIDVLTGSHGIDRLLKSLGRGDSKDQGSMAKIEARLADLRGNPKQNAVEIKALTDLLRKMDQDANGTAANKPLSLTGPLGKLQGIVTPTRKGITPAQANKFFDNALARVLLQSGLGTIQQQISGLQKANALIADRLKVTKDVTRRLNLEDQLLQNAAQIKSLNAQQAADAVQKRQDVVSELIANLQLGVTKAQATAPFGDDIAALKALQAGIKAEIREFGNTADLAGQLFDVQQQIKQAKVSNITANLFKQLGLTATGDEITPGVANLKKRLAQITENVSGLKLDTPKFEAQLARFRKVLSEGLVPKDVRAKIKEMLDGIADEINKGPHNLTKFRKASTTSLLAGLGLSPEQIRALRPRLAQIGADGTVPGARSLAFSGAGANNEISIPVTVNVDGVPLTRIVTRHQQRAAKRKPTSRRGTYAGHN